MHDGVWIIFNRNNFYYYDFFFKVSIAKLHGREWMHPISPKNPAAQWLTLPGFVESGSNSHSQCWVKWKNTWSRQEWNNSHRIPIVNPCRVFYIRRHESTLQTLLLYVHRLQCLTEQIGLANYYSCSNTVIVLLLSFKKNKKCNIRKIFKIFHL